MGVIVVVCVSVTDTEGCCCWMEIAQQLSQLRATTRFLGMWSVLQRQREAVLAVAFKHLSDCDQQLKMGFLCVSVFLYVLSLISSGHC